jgi:hypothetical protein
VEFLDKKEIIINIEKFRSTLCMLEEISNMGGTFLVVEAINPHELNKLYENITYEKLNPVGTLSRKFSVVKGEYSCNRGGFIVTILDDISRKHEEIVIPAIILKRIVVKEKSQAEVFSELMELREKLKKLEVI